MPTLDHIEVQTGPEPVGSVIWLHGLGADGHDFEPIVPHLGLPADVPLRFVFPHAPIQPVTINGGMRMRAWYDILEMSFERAVDEAGIRDSAGRIEGLIEAERARGVPADRIVLAGFSQGGAMACHVGLRYPQRLAGLLVLSAYLPLESVFEAEAHDANRDVPIFGAHGQWDPVVPYALGAHTAEFLKTRGYTVDWRTYPTEHSVHPAEVRDVGEGLAARFGQTAAM